MFRRKDTETGRSSSGVDMAGDSGYPRAVGDAKHHPELPRRGLELPAAPFPAPERAPEPSPADRAAEKKQLIVGHGISLSGEITACDRLIVLGSVQVTLNQTRAIEIAETGRFTNGRAEVEEAEISGVYEGELTVKKRLMIRATGRVQGTVRYGELEIEKGGRLSGSVSMLGDPAARQDLPTRSDSRADVKPVAA